MALTDHLGKFWTGAEVMFGVIIAMTFTSMLRHYSTVSDALLQRTLISALFCCIAWGIVDGLFYLWERSYNIRHENLMIRSSRSAKQRRLALPLIGEQLDDTVLRNIPKERREQIYRKLVQLLSTAEDRKKMSVWEGMKIVLGTFLLSVGAGSIVLAPFLFAHGDIKIALAISNILGITLLFAVGYMRSLEKGILSKIISGSTSALIGIIIAVITIVLGG
jgi:membrane protein CcdC involved in cytochrome C biogenesis